MNEPLPNGPATLKSDPKRERVTLDYAGSEIFKATVRVRRDGKDLPLKEAAVRLFALSKCDGWDVVTQIVRVTVIGGQPNDLLLLRGLVKSSEDAFACDGIEPSVTESPCRGIYDRLSDWMLSVEPESEVDVTSTDDGKFGIEALGSQVLLRFLPYYTARHRQ